MRSAPPVPSDDQDRDGLSGGELGDPSGPRHAVGNLQHALGAFEHEDGRHSVPERPVQPDLPVQFPRIRPAGRREAQLVRIDSPRIGCAMPAAYRVRPLASTESDPDEFFAP